MDFLLAIASFGIVLIPLVIIHEIGHFVAAKMVGITVLEFGVGIPPRALTLFSRSGTDYTLNWIPLGGFVRPYGEDFMSPKDGESLSADQAEVQEKGIEDPKSVFDAGPWERIWFMFAGPLFNFITAFVLFVFVALIGYPQIVDGEVVVVDTFDGSAAASAGLERSDLITAVDGQSIVSVVDFDEAIEGKENATLTVIRDGEEVELTIDLTQESSNDELRIAVQDLLEDFPAVDAGVQIDDVIIAASYEDESIEIRQLNDLSDFLQDKEGLPVTITILRGSELVETIIEPKLSDSGQVLIGVSIRELEPQSDVGIIASNTNTITEIEPADGFVDAVEVGADQFTFVMEQLARFPVDLIEGVLPLESARPVSIVGISQFGGETLRQSQEEEHPYPILTFAAFISIALAITNLLPIPALDGGRILFVFVELIRGKPLSPEREGLVHLMGFVFLLGLMVIFVVWDIVDPIQF